jgi:hypothetical protein
MNEDSTSNLEIDLHSILQLGRQNFTYARPDYINTVSGFALNSGQIH